MIVRYLKHWAEASSSDHIPCCGGFRVGPWGCGVDGPAGRAGARAGRTSGTAISLRRPRAVVSGCPLRPAVRELVLATKAGGATIATSDAPVVSASPLRPASPSVTRNRLGSSSPLRPVSLRQPHAFVPDPVRSRLCKHTQPNPTSAHARSPHKDLF